MRAYYLSRNIGSEPRINISTSTRTITVKKL